MYRFVVAASGLSLLTLACMISTATAGVVITAVDSREGKPPGQPSKIYLEPNQVRIENGSRGAIYHDGASTITTYSDQDKTYMEISPQAMSAMRNHAMEMMKQQMANMPPEQRQKIEQMMAKNGMGPEAAKPTVVTFRKTAAGQKVGQWRCDQYEEQQDGKKVADLCIARLSDVGLKEEDLHAFKGLSHVIAGFGARASQVAAAQLDLDTMKQQIGYAGLPVHTVEYSTGQQHEMTMQTIQRVSLPPATFKVPDGYTKQEMPMH